jgi:DNA-binding transcriptional ArsR family regulator
MPSGANQKVLTMSNLNDPQIAVRLAKVLQLLGSPHDGEALSAARRTIAILRQTGLEPDEVAKRLTSAPTGNVAQHRTILLETQLAAANSSIVALKAELKHWQDQAWAAASLVAELEDSVRQARAIPPDAANDSPDGALPRTQAEKRAAIMALLRDPATSGLADRELARRLALSPQTIGNWRRRLGQKVQGTTPGHVMARRGSIRSKQLP